MEKHESTVNHHHTDTLEPSQKMFIFLQPPRQLVDHMLLLTYCWAFLELLTWPPMRLTTSRAATGSLVPGPNIEEAPALYRKS